MTTNTIALRIIVHGHHRPWRLWFRRVYWEFVMRKHTTWFEASGVAEHLRAHGCTAWVEEDYERGRDA